MKPIRAKDWHVKESKVHIAESPMTGIIIGDMPGMLEFKNHPLNFVRDDLLKFEAIYPPDDPPVGFVKGKPNYGRECVHVLHLWDIWLNVSKVVCPRGIHLMIVKARPV
jgi:hypothetical protein